MANTFSDEKDNYVSILSSRLAAIKSNPEQYRSSIEQNMREVHKTVESIDNGIELNDAALTVRFNI